jgi:hypothetical protein
MTELGGTIFETNNLHLPVAARTASLISDSAKLPIILT